jgi:N6-L-threonylcarbamoyladenine synthase
MEEGGLDEAVEAQDAARRSAAELGEEGLAVRHGETVADAGRLASGNRRFPLDGGGGGGNPWPVILAVESSCDESALALLDPARGIVRELVASQVDLHARHGGVVPDLASREHLAALPLLLEELGHDLRATPPEVVAVTRGPGLLPCLSLGLAFARALALAHGARLVGVNHLRAHVHSPFMALHAADPAGFAAARAALLPHLALVVSGGNTLVVRLGEDLRMTVVARTVDDAAGEALDKGAKLLGLPYPGGARVEALAAKGDLARFAFPRGIPERADLRLSFSGLKTSLRYQVEAMTEAELAAALPDLCAGYQEAVIAQLEAKLLAALEAHPCRSVGLSGGVANNRTLRARIAAAAGRRGAPLLVAEPRHCGDNAAMVAFAALAEPGLPEGAAVRAEASVGVEG